MKFPRVSPCSVVRPGTLFISVSLSILCLFAAGSGCAGYLTGSLPDGPPTKVFLQPVQNEAYVSGMAPLFQQEVRRIALQSPHLELVSDLADADISAYVRLADYRERQVAFLEQDSGQAITSRASLSAVLAVTEPSTGRPLINEETLSVQAPIYSDPQTAFPNPVDQTKPTLVWNLAASVVLAIELAGKNLQSSEGEATETLPSD